MLTTVVTFFALTIGFHPFLEDPWHTKKTFNAELQKIIRISSSVKANENAKITAYNINSGKEIKKVSVQAVNHSPALIPCDHPDASCTSKQAQPSIVLPTEIPIPSPTAQPDPTPYPTITIIPEPSMPIPIDPTPPCDWRKYPPRPDWEVDNMPIVEMPCIFLE